MFTWLQFGLIISCAVAIILVVLVIVADGLDFNEDEVLAILSLSVFAFMIYAVISFLVLIFTTQYEDNKTQYYSDKYNLMSIQDDNETNNDTYGYFVLGFGALSSKDTTGKYYYSMVGNSEEGYLVKKYDCETTYLFMDEDKTPYVQDKIEKYQLKYHTNWLYGGIVKPLKTEEKTRVIKTELHVPKDTVKVNYNVDLQ